MRMRTSTLLVVFSSCIILSLCKANTMICKDKEKQALLSFKNALTDPTHRLSSWSPSADCCGWTGIRCDNVSGRVVGIHLANWNDTEATGPPGILGGKISPALLELQFLSHLELSYNDFGGNPIPAFLGSMQSLSVLYLFNASFGGIIPPQLGNLSSLQNLSLGCISGFSCGLRIENFSWISRLSSLEILGIQGIDLHKEVHWLEYVSVLPSLSRLYMIRCRLDTMSPSLEYVNFTSLSLLFLSFNNFNHDLPNWLFNLSNLKYMYLDGNSLQGQIPSTISNLHNLFYLNFMFNHLKGQIPETLGQLQYLRELNLFHNSLDGQIPSSIGNLSSLSALNLHSNQLKGALPESMGLLSNLVDLVITGNPLSGTVSEAHFSKLSHLKSLEMSWTHLTFNVSSNWIPPFQLLYIELISCKMGPMFPAWLQTQRYVQSLIISNSGIEDTAPCWLWEWASQISRVLDLSDNSISGNLTNVLLNNTNVFLSSNRFTGDLPRWTPNVLLLDIANNPFPRHISSIMCRKVSGGSKLLVLIMSNNSLSGELSKCLMYWSSLTHLSIGGNNISGNIPDSVGSLLALRYLFLSNNTFSGEIPSSLQNCTSLIILDLAENKLSGEIPGWIGKMSNLEALSLRSNKLTGDIPRQICQLSSLIILDLSNNSFSGVIPNCINNFSKMAGIDTALDDGLKRVLVYFLYSKFDVLSLVVKGEKKKYGDNLRELRTIDISSNNLSGTIPIEISRLSGLQFLNLSRNHLTGMIPEKVGSMISLQSLDLSRNHLSGTVPGSITNLSFLASLDLSYNHLWGRIPSGTQIQSFDALRFIGNAGLCGPPLTLNCTKKEDFEDANHTEENREEFEMTWFYIGMSSGFALSFGGVFGVLILKREWRHAYFTFLDDMGDRLYVAIVLKMKWLREHWRRQQRGARCLMGSTQERRGEREGGGGFLTKHRRINFQEKGGGAC